MKSFGLRDITKLITLVMVIGSAVYLGGVEVLPGEAVTGLISACLGYVFGNGHGVMERKC